MEWWQGPGAWFVTTAVAAVAAIGTVIQLVLHRRDRPTGILTASVEGTAMIDGERHSIVTVKNSGTGRVLVHMIWMRRCDAKFAFPDGKYRVPPSLESGGFTDLLVSGEHDEGHLLFLWTVVGSSRTWLGWAPLATEGPVVEELHRQADEAVSARHRPWRRRSWRRRGVGPGGVLRARTRFHSGKKSEARFVAALTEPTWSQGAGTAPADA